MIQLVIPAYNPGPALVDLVKSLPGTLPVLIVNDGSSPACRPIFAELGKLPQVTLLVHEHNLGKGAALKTAFAFQRGDPNLTGAITADADGQHLPEDILKILRAAESGNEDALILGVRDFTGGEPPIPFRSRFGNLITRQCFFLLTGRLLSDTQTGLRFYPAGLVAEADRITARKYDFELEILLDALRRKIRLLEIPITTVYEAKNPTSHFRPVRDSLRIYSIFWKFIFARFMAASMLASTIDYLLFSTFFFAGISLWTALVSARVVSLSVSFLLARNYVFHDRGEVGKKIVKFIALALFLFFSSALSIRYFTVEFGWHPLPVKIGCESLLFLVSYFVQKGLIFIRRQE